MSIVLSEIKMKMDWSVEDGENGYWVRRVIDTGEKDDDENPILRRKNVYKPSLKEAFDEIRKSLALVEKQAQA